MRDPVQGGTDSSDSPSLQRWIKDNYSREDDGKADRLARERVRELRAENMRRSLAHLLRCPRPVRVS